jgi:hypothetical protein
LVFGFSTSPNKNDNSMGVFALIAAIAFAYAVVATVFEKTEWKLTPMGENQRRAQIAQWKFALISTLVLVLGGAAIFYCWTPLSDSMSSRITVYPESCIQDARGACPWKPDKQRTFVVHVEQQLIVATAEDLPAPVKLHNCVVADVSNWTCTVGPEKYSSTMTMKGGEYSADGHYVSRLEWLADHLN